MSARMSAMLKDVGLSKERDTMTLLGVTREQLRRHISRQFWPGMTWELLKQGEIEIDHIVPTSAFNITDSECSEFKACWSLANLRPIWKSHNREKSDRLEFLL